MKKILTKIKEISISSLIEQLTPLKIIAKENYIRLSFSNRFMLLQILKSLERRIGTDPFLNLLSVMKTDKVFGRVISGDINEIYLNRKSVFFKSFFDDKEIYEKVKEDLEYVHAEHQDIRIIITKTGIVVYDNYKPQQFNILLLTIHNGTYVPNDVQKKMNISTEERFREEDVDTGKMYKNIVLKQGGIWIDNKCSRFYCDLNRKISRCIYDEDQGNSIKNLWKEELSEKQREKSHVFYKQFYSLITRLLELHNFNVIFDGHSMRDMEGRPSLSIGTHYIPKFYLPIVTSIKRKIASLGYEKLGINQPYEGGYILEWLSIKFPSIFIFSMEINKKLYMTKDRLRVKPKNEEKIANDLVNIFDITEEEGYRITNKL